MFSAMVLCSQRVGEVKLANDTNKTPFKPKAAKKGMPCLLPIDEDLELKMKREKGSIEDLN